MRSSASDALRSSASAVATAALSVGSAAASRVASLVERGLRAVLLSDAAFPLVAGAGCVVVVATAFVRARMLPSQPPPPSSNDPSSARLPPPPPAPAYHACAAEIVFLLVGDAQRVSGSALAVATRQRAGGAHAHASALPISAFRGTHGGLFDALTSRALAPTPPPAAITSATAGCACGAVEVAITSPLPPAVHASSCANVASGHPLLALQREGVSLRLHGGGGNVSLGAPVIVANDVVGGSKASVRPIFCAACGVAPIFLLEREDGEGTRASWYAIDLQRTTAVVASVVGAAGASSFVAQWTAVVHFWGGAHYDSSVSDDAAAMAAFARHRAAPSSPAPRTPAQIRGGAGVHATTGLATSWIGDGGVEVVGGGGATESALSSATRRPLPPSPERGAISAAPALVPAAPLSAVEVDGAPGGGGGAISLPPLPPVIIAPSVVVGAHPSTPSFARPPSHAAVLRNAWDNFLGGASASTTGAPSGMAVRGATAGSSPLVDRAIASSTALSRAEQARALVGLRIARDAAAAAGGGGVRAVPIRMSSWGGGGAGGGRDPQVIFRSLAPPPPPADFGNATAGGSSGAGEALFPSAEGWAVGGWRGPPRLATEWTTSKLGGDWRWSGLRHPSAIPVVPPPAPNFDVVAEENLSSAVVTSAAPAAPAVVSSVLERGGGQRPALPISTLGGAAPAATRVNGYSPRTVVDAGPSPSLPSIRGQGGPSLSRGPGGPSAQNNVATAPPLPPALVRFSSPPQTEIAEIASRLIEAAPSTSAERKVADTQRAEALTQPSAVSTVAAVPAVVAAAGAVVAPTMTQSASTARASQAPMRGPMSPLPRVRGIRPIVEAAAAIDAAPVSSHSIEAEGVTTAEGLGIAEDVGAGGGAVELSVPPTPTPRTLSPHASPVASLKKATASLVSTTPPTMPASPNRSLPLVGHSSPSRNVASVRSNTPSSSSSRPLTPAEKMALRVASSEADARLSVSARLRLAAGETFTPPSEPAAYALASPATSARSTVASSATARSEGVRGPWRPVASGTSGGPRAFLPLSPLPRSRAVVPPPQTTTSPGNRENVIPARTAALAAVGSAQKRTVARSGGLRERGVNAGSSTPLRA